MLKIDPNSRLITLVDPKKLKRKRAEIMMETGQPVSRGNLYIHTHTRADGTYINEEARIVCEKIIEIENQGITSMKISPNDSLGQVFGKEHPGRVRGVGDGVCPSQIFGSSNPRFGGIPTSTNSVQELKIEVRELKNQIETKDGNMKTMATLLAQLLRHSSMSVPAELLDVIQ